MVVYLDTPGEVRERHKARQQGGAKLRVVFSPAVERQGMKERIQGHASPLLRNECSDLAFVLGDDSEAPASRLASRPRGNLPRPNLNLEVS